MNIRPLNNRILVRRDDAKSIEGLIHVPEAAKEPPVMGRVVAVGVGKRLDDGTLVPLDVTEGDHVLFSKYGGTEVEVDGVKHLLLREDELLAVIE